MVTRKKLTLGDITYLRVMEAGNIVREYAACALTGGTYMCLSLLPVDIGAGINDLPDSWWVSVP